MSKPKLHLDADASMISLTRALMERDHDVTRTPNNWMPPDATDEDWLEKVFWLIDLIKKS